MQPGHLQYAAGLQQCWQECFLNGGKLGLLPLRRTYPTKTGTVIYPELLLACLVEWHTCSVARSRARISPLCLLMLRWRLADL